MEDDAVVAYLRANRDRFTREALTAQLLNAGHDPATVEAAWAKLDAEANPSPWAAGAAERPGSGKDLRPRAALIVIGAYVATWLFFAVGARWDGGYLPTGLALGILAGSLVVAGLLSLLVVRLSGRLRRGEGLSSIVIVFVLPLVLLAGIAGICATTNPSWLTAAPL